MASGTMLQRSRSPAPCSVMTQRWGCGGEGPRARGYVRETERDGKEGEKEGEKKGTMEKKVRQ